MRTIKKWKAVIAVIAMTIVCETSCAQRYHWHYPHQVVTVVTCPAQVSTINNSLNKKERLAMAVAYLNGHKILTIKTYAKMTRQSKTAAEAELDAFAMDKTTPIRMFVKGKKKVYIKK